MLLVGGWLRRQWATCGRSWLTALRWPGNLWSKSADGAAAWRLLGVLLCTETRSMGCAVQWSPMKPVPTKVFADLLLLVVMLRLTERAARTRELHCWRCMC
jgi:hypothetical protein